MAARLSYAGALICAALLLAATATLPQTSAGFVDSTATTGNSFATGLFSGVIKAIAGGDQHACLVSDDSFAWCWGSNSHGQLGDNSTNDSFTAVQVQGPGGAGFFSDATTLDAGHRHTCAVKADGTVWCWGINDKFQLGDGTSDAALTPTQVVGPGGTGVLSGIIAIGTGESHSCGLEANGSVWCWGANADGQLGDGTFDDSPTPVQVVGPGGAGVFVDGDSLMAGPFHACASKTDGTLWCWGAGNDGQLGDGTTDPSSSPVQVVGVGGAGVLSGVDSAQGGLAFTCATKDAGSVFCWGDNADGQLGDGTTNASTTPVQVVGPGGVGLFSGAVGGGAGAKHACAVTSGGSGWCWGRNDKGQLGDNSNTDSPTPVQIAGFGGTGTLSGVSLIGPGNFFSCASLDDDTAACWGENGKGQLGDNTTDERLAPVQVQGLS